MQEVIDKISEAHQMLKDQAVQALQNDQEIAQEVMDAIKSIFALIQALKQHV